MCTHPPRERPCAAARRRQCRPPPAEREADAPREPTRPCGTLRGQQSVERGVYRARTGFQRSSVPIRLSSCPAGSRFEQPRPNRRTRQSAAQMPDQHAANLITHAWRASSVYRSKRKPRGGVQEAPGAERASTYTQACFPEASIAATRLYVASCSYWSAAASSASVISNTVPFTRLSFLPLNVTLA